MCIKFNDYLTATQNETTVYNFTFRLICFSIFRSFNLEFLWTYYQIRILFKLQHPRNYHVTSVSIGAKVKREERAAGNNAHISVAHVL